MPPWPSSRSIVVRADARRGAAPARPGATICSTAGFSRKSPAAALASSRRSTSRASSGSRRRSSSRSAARSPAGTLERAVEEVLDPPPALRGHGRPSSRKSHARAERNSRLTDDGEVSMASAVSSIERPPKKRSSTIRACASSSAFEPNEGLVERQQIDVVGRLGRRDPDVERHRERLAPPRLSASRARAWSMRIRRIACDAIAKKCPRFFHVTRVWSTSRKYASWTTAVGWSVCPARSRRNWRSAISRSSRVDQRHQALDGLRIAVVPGDQKTASPRRASLRERGDVHGSDEQA